MSAAKTSARDPISAFCSVYALSGNPADFAGAALDDDVEPELAEEPDDAGHERDAPLTGEGFFRNADLHDAENTEV